MKVIIALEDTERGVIVSTDVTHNGCNDGGARSVALGASISLGFHLDNMQRVGAINVVDRHRANVPTPRR